MNAPTGPAVRLGRPPSASADSHEAIITAVYELLQEMSLRELTMEKVAKRAGVGKPTLYRWWKTKAALVIAMFNERIVPAINPPPAASLEQSLQHKVQALIEAFNGFFGKVIAEIVAEGQSDAEVLREFNELYIQPRRNGTIDDIRQAQKQGLVPAHVDPEMVVDATFGCLYYNLLLKLRPLTPAYGRQLVAQGMQLLNSPADPGPRHSP